MYCVVNLEVKKMSTVFPYYFDDGQTTFHGTFFIKDVYQTKIYEENFKGIKAVIALKKEYLQEEPSTYEKQICFTSQNRAKRNQYEVMVVNADMEEKLPTKKMLHWLLHDPIKNPFIGNEKYLVTIT
ncbi:hypothetical protein EEL30_04890 [Brevibacillus laterosporus]|uniref:Orfx1 TULIPs domain-containing protein n=1 Tax=Brevibacillus laterosporus TaxID=1465 RepID=A0A518V454_BRELA|nr:hypothetical protein EEL30_04890 [Brevibacillus laterosporus]